MLKISKIAVPGVAEPYDIGTLSIPFGQVDSTSTDTAYTAQIEGITSLYDGVCVYLKNGVITSNKNGFTLNINGLGAKPVYDTLAAATRSGTVFNVDYTMLFVYNSSRVSGGCWDIFYGYNSDTTNLEEALTPLTGTTETLTPTQVYDAIKSGKSVVLQHTHSLLGLFTFASFNIFEREKTVVSNSIAKNGGTYLVGSLAGLAGGNEWVFNITEMAEADDIPVAVNEALAQAKASGEFDGADGKSAYAYAQDGGYTGTETEFAAKLAQEQLAGTTDELTPTQVYNAVSAGIPVKVQYTDSTYGLISFTAFTVSESQNVIASSMIAYYNGVYILCELVGDKSRNVWGFETTTLAQKEHSHSASDVKVTVTIGETQMDVPLSNYLTDTILPMIQSRLLLKGGTMSGAINMGANSITNLAAPTADADAATKKYVDEAISLKDISLNELGICYANCTTAFTTTAKTAAVTNYKLVLGGLVAIKFTNSVIAHSTLNINNTGAKDIYYNGVAIQSNIIQSNDIALFVYNGRHYDLLTTNFKNTLPVTETNYIWCNTNAAATIKTAALPGFSLPTGANSPTTRMVINFLYGVPANAKLNISNTGARNIICNNANITANTIQANDVVTLETYWNAALTTPTAQYIVRAIDRNNIRHVYQNTLGINNISTKNVTGHIYESPIDIKGYLSTTMEIGSVTVTNPSVHIYNNMNSFANVAPDIVGQQIGTAYVQNGAEEYIAPIICDSITQTTPVSLQTHLANLTIPANSTPSYKLQIICPKK